MVLETAEERAALQKALKEFHGYATPAQCSLAPGLPRLIRYSFRLKPTFSPKLRRKSVERPGGEASCMGEGVFYSRESWEAWEQGYV